MALFDDEYWREWSKRYLGREKSMKDINRFMIGEIASMLAQSVDWVRRIAAIMYVVTFPPFPKKCLTDMEANLGVTVSSWKTYLLETTVEEVNLYSEKKHKLRSEVIKSIEYMTVVFVPTRETVDYLSDLVKDLEKTKFKAKSVAVKKFIKMYKDTEAFYMLPSFNVISRLGKLKERYEAHKYAQRLLTPKAKCKTLWHMYIMQEAFKRASQLWERISYPYNLPMCFRENEEMLNLFGKVCLEEKVKEEAAEKEAAEAPPVKTIIVKELPLMGIKMWSTKESTEAEEEKDE